jgi:Holliday junction resolvasome RuvABC ATP-dependent DNA helicase subunit
MAYRLVRKKREIIDHSPLDLYWEEEDFERAFPEHIEESKEKPLRIIIEEERVPTKWETKLFFDKDDPQNWKHYHGQGKIKEFVQLQIDVVPQDEGLKFLFIAPKGSGKTTLFRIIAKKLIEKRGGRYFEITPAMVNTKDRLDDLMVHLGDRDVLCIDEIHMLNRTNADTLLPAIEDNVFPFNEGMRKLPEGVTWIGATTDIGLLPEAFQDRFQILTLEHLPVKELTKILQDLHYPIFPEAAMEIALRSIGSPRELKRIYKVCRDVCVRDKASRIGFNHTLEAFRLLDLDENGLYYQDRKVLRALYNNPKLYAPRADGTQLKRYAHSERAIRALTGLDENLYRDQIEPKLLRQGFLTIGTGGRELTEKAFAVYFSKRK